MVEDFNYYNANELVNVTYLRQPIKSEIQASCYLTPNINTKGQQVLFWHHNWNHVVHILC